MSFVNTPINVSSKPTSIAAITDSDVQGSKLPLYKTIGSDHRYSISDFLAKPIRLYSYTDAGSAYAAVTEQYATDFMAHASVQQKLKYTRLLRGTFVIDILVTSTPYAIGQIVCCNYMGPFASYNAPLIDNSAFAVSFDTKNKVILDMATTNTATMKIPLRIKNPYLITSKVDPDLINHEFGLAILVPIISTATGTASPSTISVYVSMIDTEIAVPVIQDDGSIYTSEVQRTADGPLSYPMSVLSAASMKLSNIPVIGPFAMATSLISGAIGQAATLFGYSRPNDLSAPPYPHEEDFATAAGEIRSKTLCLDPTNETTFPGTHVGDIGDALTYQNIIGRYGIIEFTTWSSASPRGTTLDYIPVTPGYSSQKYSSVWALSPLAYGSMMYQLWRGTMVYEVTIPCNRFVRGKVRVGWSPTVISNTVTRYGDITHHMPSVIIDLSVGAVVEFRVPWAAYRSHLCVMSPACDTKISGASDLVNGYLYFIVEDPVVAQSATISLTIITRVKAGDDFQLQVPDTQKLQYFHRQLWDPVFANNTTIQADMTGNASNFVTGNSVDTINNDNQYNYWTMETTSIEPVIQTSQALLPPSDNALASAIHMGEAYNSFRPALQRFYPYYYMRANVGTAGGWNSLHLPYLPWEPLFANVAGTSTYTPVAMTPIRWLSNLFYGVHGTIRYRVNVGSVGSTSYLPRISFFRSFDYAFQRRIGSVAHSITRWIRGKSSAAMGEASYAPSNGESIIVDAPYQCVSNYISTIKNTETITVANYGYGLTMFMSNPFAATENMEIYTAIGEGFNPVIWNGVPLMICAAPGSTTGALIVGIDEGGEPDIINEEDYDLDD